METSCRKFACICVKLQLDKPMVGQVSLRNHWFHIEYEGFNLLCNKCGYYGHVARNYTTEAASKSTIEVHENENNDTPSVENVVPPNPNHEGRDNNGPNGNNGNIKSPIEN